MDKRIQATPRVRDLLWKLENKRMFREQFGSAQAYLEWSLEKAVTALNRHPFKGLE
jgi:hypothetical protein